jgi:acyl carrier protein
MEFENAIRIILTKTANLTEHIEEIDLDTDLKDVGVDSLVFIRVVVEIENHFSIDFPDDKLFIAATGTIRTLCKTVESLLHKMEKDNQKIC